MRALLLVLLLTTVVCSLKLDTSNAAWQRFKEKFNKSYATPHEESMRRNIWANNLLEIAELNAKHNTNGFGETPASDLTDEEFRSMYLMSPDQVALLPKIEEIKNDNLGMVVPVFDTPESYDLRSKGYVTDVKDQSSCGSCWAFTTAAVAETAYIKAGNPKTSLSPQYVLDCTTPYSFSDGSKIENSCSGGNAYFGLVTGLKGFSKFDSSCPYSAVDHNKCTCPVNVAGGFYTTIYAVEEKDFTYAVSNDHAVAVAVDATAWNKWGGADACNYLFPCGQVGSPATGVDHAVTLVGYTSDYWIIKNSWSTGFGCQGYYFIGRSPANQCLIDMWQSIFVD